MAPTRTITAELPKKLVEEEKGNESDDPYEFLYQAAVAKANDKTIDQIVRIEHTTFSQSPTVKIPKLLKASSARHVNHDQMLMEKT